MKILGIFKSTLLIAMLLLPSLLIAEEEKQEVQIASMLCLTGDCAEWGTNSLKGVRLAIEEQNKQSDFQFTLLAENSADMNPSQAVSAYQRIIRELQPAIIIGPTWSIASGVLTPIVKNNKNALMMSPTVGVRDFNESSDNLFNIWPHDDVGSSALGKHAFEKGDTTIAIITAQLPWELTQVKTFRKAYEEAGGKVLEYIEYQYSDKDLKSMALKIRSKNPKAVLLANYNQMGVFSRYLKNLGYKGQLYTILMDKNQIAQAKGALEGIVFAMYPEASEVFKNAYDKKYGEKPGVGADTGYDAMNIIAQSLKQISKAQIANQKTPHVDITRLIEQISKVKNYQGASGLITFDGEGGIYREPVFFKLQGESYTKM